MLKSLWIKLPALLLVLASFVFASGLTAWLFAALVLTISTSLIALFVFNPRSSFWITTLSSSRDGRNAVALTFDDGPDPTYTPRVLSILAEKHVPATFFLVGKRADAHPSLVADIANAGHIVGNHSYAHDLTFHFRLWKKVTEEIALCNDAIKRAIGKEPLLFRSPQGFKNPALGDVLKACGMHAIGWEARGLDAFERDSDKIVGRIVSGAKPGAVLLLHDGAGLNGTRDREPTLAALPKIIDALRASGLELVPLDELLRIKAYR